MDKAVDKNLERKRIFIASPGNLDTERKLFPEILATVNKRHAKSKGIILEPVGWEDTLPGRGRPQEKINEDLKTCNLIVMLLWKRWGSTTGEYSSGFEEEYELAYKEGKEIWLYFRSIPDDMLADPGPQLEKVLDFRKNIESEKKLLFHVYEDEQGWKELFMDNLCLWLDGLLPVTFKFEQLGEYKTKIEELEKEIEKKKSEQIKIAYDLSDEAKELADSGRITSAEEHFARAIAITKEPYILNDYALFLMRIGTLKKAEKIFEQLSSIGKVMSDRKIQAMALGNIGILYKIRGDINKAEKMYKKALAINKKLGLKEVMAALYGNLGNIYLIRRELKEAEKMFKKSLAIHKELGNKEGMANAYGNLGNIYLTRGELEEAEKMFKKSLAINQELGRKEGMANQYGSLGNIYLKRGDLEKAEKMFKKSLAIHKELGNKEGMANAYGNLGTLYKDKGNLEEAENMYKKSLAIYTSFGNKEMIKKLKSLLEKLEELKKKKKE